MSTPATPEAPDVSRVNHRVESQRCANRVILWVLLLVASIVGSHFGFSYADSIVGDPDRKEAARAAVGILWPLAVTVCSVMLIKYVRRLEILNRAQPES